METPCLPVKIVDWIFLIGGNAGCAGRFFLCTNGLGQYAAQIRRYTAFEDEDDDEEETEPP